ncbi:AAA family ATPase [Echinicola vietnamensis]|uniref:Putative ATPase/kinase involved in NAD metabolism n=1 Tax=Echinicola vietnamensis (strain DSM 17526 / LMG 23754 / KMM 6221) TaxID=926556 RepID=L0FXJ6_ECHVK|nr:ATP-binding protein [Echinicola vietnamensis]AGA77380.1 putative ATPase/kinase involved in NAD metabolism [Echinicola vietnamensis DSM 17526]
MPKQPKKIVVIGPESTGKSTLSEALAAHYGVPWVAEYAREYIEQLDREYRYEDLLEIAKGQINREEQKLKQAKSLLFCDTDLHVIHVWSEYKYHKTADWIMEQIAQRHYDLYLLTDIDIPWEEDPQREYPDPEMRRFFYDWYERLMSTANAPVVNISGNLDQRLSKAITAIQHHLGKGV